MNEYSALIRTFNSERTLPATLRALERQTVCPRQFVFVDSGSSDGTLACFPPGALVHRFVGAEFNYAEALNQGLKLVSTGYVLIVSSHTILENERAIEYALGVLASDEKLGGAYFCDRQKGLLRYELIHQGNFDGHNGLWNTCSLLKVPMLRERGFRPEVFTAEDQEWASWFFRCKGGAIARVFGAGMLNQNPRFFSRKKQLNEAIAVACFAKPELLGWRNLADIAWRAVSPSARSRSGERLFSGLLLFHLLSCRLFGPQRLKRRSRYF